jgi:predicted anti-sigma-YlaC factor YlaD
MRCDDARVALSARLDGEAPPASLVDADGHLRTCGACRAWFAAAEQVTGAVRRRAADPVPDLTVRILAAVAADQAAVAPTRPTGKAPRTPIMATGLRLTLGLAAIVQLLLAVPALLGAVGHDAHAGREVAAFDIALAVGFLLAACYPAWARGFVPVAAALVVCLGVASVLDMADGVVSPSHEIGHLLAFVQTVLVWVLARRTRPSTEPPVTRAGRMGMIAQ